MVILNFVIVKNKLSKKHSSDLAKEQSYKKFDLVNKNDQTNSGHIYHYRQLQ